MERTRRWLIKGAASLLAAPAIVRASALMPVKAWASEHIWVDLLGLPVDGQPTYVGSGRLPVDPLYLVDPLYFPIGKVVFDVSPMLGHPHRWGIFSSAPLEQITAPVPVLPR
jgi:hypothetical protein